MSGSISNRGAALFNKPTSSSNSDANTDEGSLMEAVWTLTSSSSMSSSSSAGFGRASLRKRGAETSSVGWGASLRCCR
uniref:Uncharacterized protein n=1 Tax=Sinocyclocheilus rhinocerous TaxID=307959 RepID=A0A673JZP2_9TELE